MAMKNQVVEQGIALESFLAQFPEKEETKPEDIKLDQDIATELTQD